MTEKTQEKKFTLQVVREYTEVLIIALALALFIRTFIIQAFKIPSGSMIPTLAIGDHILVSKFSYGVKIPFTDICFLDFHKPEREDVIVFREPKQGKKDFIKRVMGLTGDRIEVKNKKLYINGQIYEDRHAYFAGNRFRSGIDNFGPVTVPEGHYFMMGDNRDNSSDSRVWGFVPFENIRGKALIIYISWVISDSWNIDVKWNRIGKVIR
ncbi:signal peptidase I [Thermodesulfobacteriota bacterium]